MTNCPARALLLALALGSAAQAGDSNGVVPVRQRESPLQPSVTVVAHEPANTAPPYPEGAEKLSIRDYIVENSGPIRECYAKRLAERPTLQGKLIARFDIGPTGRVIGATADGIADRELILCVVTAVRKFEFEKPQSGGKLRIAYPFKFEPRPVK